MERGELGEVRNEAVPAGLADQLFVELQLALRRLRRIEQLVGAVSVEGRGSPWPGIRSQCSAAFEAVSTAAASVPDAPYERDREQRPLVVRDLRVDPYARRAWFGERELELPSMEFGLLGALALDPTRVHSKAELLRNVWGFKASPRTRTVDSHASRLRGRLADAGAIRGEWVVNHWGFGYALVRPRLGDEEPLAASGGGP